MEDIFEELAAGISDDEEKIFGGPESREGEAEEAPEETRRIVKPKRTVSRPRPKLDTARLLGPRGIFDAHLAFNGVKFKGKGHELDDLNQVLTRLQHWAHRLFPKLKFSDCVEKIEDLGQKKEIQTNMYKIRMGLVDRASTSDQIDDGDNPVVEPDDTQQTDDIDFSGVFAPVAPSARTETLTDEQRARMVRNRLLAEERRIARRLAKEKEMQAQLNFNAPSTSEPSSTEACIPSTSDAQTTSNCGNVDEVGSMSIDLNGSSVNYEPASPNERTTVVNGSISNHTKNDTQNPILECTNNHFDDVTAHSDKFPSTLKVQPAPSHVKGVINHAATEEAAKTMNSPNDGDTSTKSFEGDAYSKLSGGLPHEAP